MKNTVEAVRYGIETLKVSPNEMFSLIESSQGYEGSDYKRWLANEIIKVAEKDGIGFSQLLVKKLSIVSSIMENVDVSIKPRWVEYFKACIGKNAENIYSINFDEVGQLLEGIDWYNGIDLFCDKTFSDTLPELGSSYAFVAKLESDPCDKSSELVKYAKEHNIVCKNKGSLLLHRMCNYVEANQFGSEFMFAFFVNVGFLYNLENQDSIDFFLRYFHYVGVVIDSSDLLTDVSGKNKYAFVMCTPRAEEVIQNGIRLPEITCTEDYIEVSAQFKRYSRGSKFEFDYLRDTVSSGSRLGTIYMDKGNLKVVSGLEDTRSNLDDIAILNTNYREAIVFYSVWWSLRSCGFSTDIKEIITGSQDFDELYYNCLPLFLFNTDSVHSIDSDFNVEESDFAKKLIDEAEVHFSYEAKELMTVCKGFLDFCGDEAKGKSFEDIRLEASHDGLNSAYLLALSKLKEYICSLYRRLEL